MNKESKVNLAEKSDTLLKNIFLEHGEFQSREELKQFLYQRKEISSYYKTN